MTGSANLDFTRKALRLVFAIGIVAVVSACSMFGQNRINEEPIVPAEELFASATQAVEQDRLITALERLEQLERQHPYSTYNERAKVMITFVNFRRGAFDEAVRAADRYLALFPGGSEAAYVTFLKGSAYYQQIRDITRDQEIAQNAIDTLNQVITTWPRSEYVAESREMIQVARNQVAGREMSVGRYYLGNGQIPAGINRFRTVVEDHQTSIHVEEALYRLTEGYLILGLANEARTAAAVLGHNYPSSEWYQRAFALLSDRGLTPQMMTGNWLSSR